MRQQAWGCGGSLQVLGLHHHGRMGTPLARGKPLLASQPTPGLLGREKGFFSLLPRCAGVPPATLPVAPGQSPVGCIPSHTLPNPSQWSGMALPSFPSLGQPLPASTPLSPVLRRGAVLSRSPSPQPSGSQRRCVPSQTPQHCGSKGEAASVCPSPSLPPCAAPHPPGTSQPNLQPCNLELVNLSQWANLQGLALKLSLFSQCNVVGVLQPLFTLHKGAPGVGPATATSHMWHFPGQSITAPLPAPSACQCIEGGTSLSHPQRAPAHQTPRKTPAQKEELQGSGSGQHLLGRDPTHPPGDAAAGLVCQGGGRKKSLLPTFYNK